MSRAYRRRRSTDCDHTSLQLGGPGDRSGLARKLRCAVYTRKSTDEGLEMEFNSLDAQRESCGSYIASQRAERWMLVDDRYDDGGSLAGTWSAQR